MFGWFGRDARRRRIEEQAYAWVVKIDADREAYEPGFRRWVGSDAERARTYNRARRAFLGAAAPAEAIYGPLRQRGAVAQARGMRAIPYRRLIILTACLVLAGFGLSLVVSLLTGRVAEPASTSLTSMSLATRIGEVRSVRLGDGSRIILDTNTRITVRYTRTARLLTLLQGRARFEVAHNPTWPFVVAADGGTVTARGTVFDVDVERDVVVHLLTGAIDVRLPAGKSRAIVLRHLVTGEKITYAEDVDNHDAATSVARASDAQWVTGMKAFDDVPVSEIVAEANRYTTRKIVLGDPTVGAREVFVDVDIRDPLAVARKLAGLLGLQVDESRANVITLTPNQ